MKKNPKRRQPVLPVPVPLGDAWLLESTIPGHSRPGMLTDLDGAVIVLTTPLAASLALAHCRTTNEHPCALRGIGHAELRRMRKWRKLRVCPTMSDFLHVETEMRKIAAKGKPAAPPGVIYERLKPEATFEKLTPEALAELVRTVPYGVDWPMPESDNLYNIYNGKDRQDFVWASGTDVMAFARVGMMLEDLGWKVSDERDWEAHARATLSPEGPCYAIGLRMDHGGTVLTHCAFSPSRPVIFYSAALAEEARAYCRGRGWNEHSIRVVTLCAAGIKYARARNPILLDSVEELNDLFQYVTSRIDYREAEDPAMDEPTAD